MKPAWAIADDEPGRATVGLPDTPDERARTVNNAATRARIIRTAVQRWQATNNTMSCPTVGQLQTEGLLDPPLNDPWGRPYALRCSDDEVRVSSAGADGARGTTDDITVPK